MTNERIPPDEVPQPGGPEPRGEPSIWAGSEGGEEAPPPADPDPEPVTDLDIKLAPDTYTDRTVEAETRGPEIDTPAPPPEDPPPVTDPEP